jgi:hypothetical protein
MAFSNETVQKMSILMAINGDNAENIFKKIDRNFDRNATK